MKISKRHFHASIKMFIVGTIGTIIAYHLNIGNYLTSGVIAILSIHLTKYDSFQNAVKRLTSGVYAIILSVLFFHFISKEFHLLAYLLILIIFPLTSHMFKIQVGIVPSLVLVTHFLLSSQITPIFILEEVGILVIAITVASLINLFYPLFGYEDIDLHLDDIDKLISNYIIVIASVLDDFDNNYEDALKLKENLEIKIELTIDEIDSYYKDKILDNTKTYLDYLYMRNTQIFHINNIYKLIDNIEIDFKDIASPLVSYIKDLSLDISRNNKAIIQLEKLDLLLDYYRNETSLPKTRDEFETRALLYQMIYELKSLLEVKIRFHDKHQDFRVKE